MKQVIAFRGEAEIALSEQIAKDNGTTASAVIRLALQHGLPIARERLAMLRPSPTPVASPRVRTRRSR